MGKLRAGGPFGFLIQATKCVQIMLFYTSAFSLSFLHFSTDPSSDPPSLDQTNTKLNCDKPFLDKVSVILSGQTTLNHTPDWRAIIHSARLSRLQDTS